MYILAAETVTISNTAIALVVGIPSVLWTGIKIMDRLYLKDEKAASAPDTSRHLAALTDAITALTIESKSQMQVSTARHLEIINGMNALHNHIQNP